MTTRRLAIFMLVMAFCLFSAFLFAGETAKPGDKPEKPSETGKATSQAPETPAQEEARIKKTYSKYAIVFIDVEETVIHLGGKKEKTKTGGFGHMLSFGLRLTTGRSYKGEKYDEYRKKMKITGVDNSHLWIFKAGSRKPKLNRKDKKEKAKKFTAKLPPK